MAEKAQDMDTAETNTTTNEQDRGRIPDGKRDDVTRRLFALKRRVQQILDEIDDLNNSYRKSAD